MVEIEFEEEFKKKLSKINYQIKEKIKKQLWKIKENPLIGKPMRFGRKGTREVYIKPFRLSYIHNKEENCIIFLELYHKKRP